VPINLVDGHDATHQQLIAYFISFMDQILSESLRQLFLTLRKLFYLYGKEEHETELVTLLLLHKFKLGY